MGQEGLAPPLVGTDWMASSPERLIRIVLHGLRGPIKVKDQTYEMDMPALGVLDDEQVASALTYTRRNWGHTYSAVTPEMVKKVRQETEKREEGWTEAELLKIP
jgi:mono/diheme cytochrome c family protein